MPPPALLDLATLDLSRSLVPLDEIRAANPQRHEFALLDGIVHEDRENLTIAGYHDVKPDAWWVRGHIPGRPLMPGVLMIETAAQLVSFIARRLFPDIAFFGFGGVDEVKFRGTVVPPARFLVVGRCLEAKRRRVIFSSQGFVDGTMVFEGVITGMAV